MELGDHGVYLGGFGGLGEPPAAGGGLCDRVGDVAVKLRDAGVT